MIPKNIKKYFWDVDFKQLDLKNHAEFVIARLLEYGDIKALRWLFKFFSKQMIKKVILKHRGFSLPTVNLWRLFFNLNENKITCLKKK